MDDGQQVIRKAHLSSQLDREWVKIEISDFRGGGGYQATGPASTLFYNQMRIQEFENRGRGLGAV